MALVTRCPGCNSIFSLTIAELQAHDGKVQCGQCTQLFDALVMLITVPESLITKSPLEAKVTQANKSKLPSQNELTPSAFSIQDQEKEILAAVDQFDVQSARKTSRHWLFASLLMIFILTVQGIYFYRTELSIAIPGTRPFLENYCTLLQCTIKPPKHIALLSLESSDLQANPAHQPGILTLIATIRNHAPFPQELPALLLTFTDMDDQTLASRLLTAHDYLDKESDPQVFSANSEIDIKLYFDNSDLNAMGYRLLLLYP
ncbi:zinc-ribbon and DUF3426 domain-containing protein [Nitrosomonas sp. Nm58]|uniref:zinc-ribbon and DUF3426 domain-containing protein n=1 Tax=Nitrosomonas sp. Nm58 TaxID=200126 RepID=UPI00089D6D91|nr:zinc-ribbon and DUF3426 domain-containing protein [Nitrosomonas sp. Nm58]SDY23461.1 MJ0042 family finger-like domain-containing protein [Nitrosomonas sp. Nm58]